MRKIKLLSAFLVLIYIGGCMNAIMPQLITDYHHPDKHPDVRYEYNDTKGEGNYLTTAVTHYKDFRNIIYSTVSISCDDQGSCEPTVATISITSRMPVFITERGGRLHIKADNERFSFEDELPYFSADPYWMTEVSVFALPISTLNKIAKAENVSAEYNGFDLDFSYEKRSKYRKIVSAWEQREPEKYLSEY